MDYAPAGAFTSLAADDGTTPFHLAFQMGHFSVDVLTQQLAADKLLAAPGSAGAARLSAAAAKAVARAARAVHKSSAAAIASAGKADDTRLNGPRSCTVSQET
jgi:hypothetical protein